MMGQLRLSPSCRRRRRRGIRDDLHGRVGGAPKRPDPHITTRHEGRQANNSATNRLIRKAMPCDADARRATPGLRSRRGPAQAMDRQDRSPTRRACSAPTDPTSSPTPSPAPTGVTEERLGVGQGEHDRERSIEPAMSETPRRKTGPRPDRRCRRAACRAHVTDALDGVNTSEVGDLRVIVDVQDDRGRHGAVLAHGVAQILSEQKCGTIGGHERSLREEGATAHPEQPGVAEGHVAPYSSSHGQRAIHRHPTPSTLRLGPYGRTHRLKGHETWIPATKVEIHTDGDPTAIGSSSPPPRVTARWLSPTRCGSRVALGTTVPARATARSRNSARCSPAGRASRSSRRARRPARSSGSRTSRSAICARPCSHRQGCRGGGIQARDAQAGQAARHPLIQSSTSSAPTSEHSRLSRRGRRCTLRARQVA